MTPKTEPTPAPLTLRGIKDKLKGGYALTNPEGKALMQLLDRMVVYAARDRFDCPNALGLNECSAGNGNCLLPDEDLPSENPGTCLECWQKALATGELRQCD